MSSEDLNPLRFASHRAVVGDGVEMSYVHEGVGGVPLLLVHGWPGSKRLFWRNIAPLAAAGFEVMVPDQRGFFESSIPEVRPDIATSSKDLKALLAHLGHEQAVLVGGDFGSAVIQDMANRFPNLALRQVLFNGASPVLPELFAEHGIEGEQFAEIGEISTHLAEHGQHADELAADLDTPDKRQDYVKGFYLNRVWKNEHGPRGLAAPGGFDDASASFMAEPFRDADHFRAGLGLYEGIMDPNAGVDPPRLLEMSQTETMILYGMEDQIVGPKFVTRTALGCPQHVGPFYIPGAGHFLQWEQADVLNNAIVCFCRDLLAARRAIAGRST